MKVYNIKKGTEGKLITQEPNAGVTVKSWVTRKDLTFTHPVLDAVGYANSHPKLPSDSLAVRLVNEGYSLFSTTNNEKAEHILAVKSTDVELLI